MNNQLARPDRLHPVVRSDTDRQRKPGNNPLHCRVPRLSEIFMSRIALAVAVVVALFAAAPARAECTYPVFDFFPERNGGVTVDTVAVAGTPCAHNFGEGPGYHFTSVAIALKPEHGRLQRQGGARFVYTPTSGYSGKDAYMIQICATKGAQKGCTGIAFLVDVRK